MRCADTDRGDLAAIIAECKPLLTAPVEPDIYLSTISRQWTSHRFLGHCTQTVFRRQIRFLTRVLTAYTRKQPGDVHVLDWGCGKGHITYLLNKQGFRVTTCDRLETRNDSAFGQDTPIIFEQHIKVIPLEDPVRLPFEDASFDCVVSFGVLEHVQDDQGSLTEIARVLKPDGVLFVTFLPYPLSWTQAVARLRGNDYHDRLYFQRRLLELASRARLTVEAAWLAQLLPKNSIPFRLDPTLEPLDRLLCRLTPLRYFATNLEAVLRKGVGESENAMLV